MLRTQLLEPPRPRGIYHNNEEVQLFWGRSRCCTVRTCSTSLAVVSRDYYDDHSACYFHLASAVSNTKTTKQLLPDKGQVAAVAC